jgi:hypothetical protein
VNNIVTAEKKGEKTDQNDALAAHYPRACHRPDLSLEGCCDCVQGMADIFFGERGAASERREARKGEQLLGEGRLVNAASVR